MSSRAGAGKVFVGIVVLFAAGFIILVFLLSGIAYRII
jgi:hypothetical protein